MGNIHAEIALALHILHERPPLGHWRKVISGFLKKDNGYRPEKCSGSGACDSYYLHNVIYTAFFSTKHCVVQLQPAPH
jgi:hypothetical protein